MKFNSYIKARVGWHGLSSEEHQDEGAYLVTGTDFEEGGIDWDSCVHVSVERYKQDPYIILRDGDLLITKDGTIGKTAVVDGLGVKQATLNSGVFVIRPLQDAYSTSFLYWVFNSKVFTGFISLESAGSTIQHLYQRTLNEFSFPEVPHQEQDAINAFLNHETTRIDALIEKKQRLIELLKEKRQAVITQAVTKGLDPNVPMKDSGVEWLGEVPEHWSTKQIHHLVSFIGGGTPSKENEYYWQGDIPWVSPKDMKTDSISSAIDNITLQAVTESSATLITQGAVLIVVRGMILLHSVPVALTEVDLTINQDMKALVPNNAVNAKYLLYLLKGIRDLILSLVDSSAHGTRVLPTEEFKRLEVAIPTPDEQSIITTFIESQLSRFDRLLGHTTKSIQLLQEHRSALITAAVTGQIDVRNLA
jgi:type I restriction enzyme S subunit